MNIKLNVDTVISLCDTIIDNINNDRGELYEEEINKLMNRKFFRKTRKQAEVCLKSWEEDTDIFVSIPDWVIKYGGQKSHLERMISACELLKGDGKTEMILNDEDIYRLGY